MVREVSGAARPIVIQQPRAAPVAKRGGRRKGGGGGLSLSGDGGILGMGLTAAVIGMAEKAGLLANLPTVPIVGRKGALAIGMWYWSKHGGGSLARDAAIAAAVLAGHELGTTGSISGEDD